MDATAHWRIGADGIHRRGVLVRDVDDTLVRVYLPDTHPALVRFLARAQAVQA